jgi:hypothetical protein
MYLRHLTTAGANNNAFRADAFDVSPSDANSFANLQPSPDPDYKWTPDIGAYVVAAGDVGEQLSFTFKYQDNGFIADRFVFSTVQDLNDAQLDALVNSIPEPGSLALLGTGGLCLLKRRRRR